MEKTNKEKNVVIILLIVIIMILAVLCVLFATNTITLNKDNKDSSVNSKSNDVNKYISKINNEKDWIYNAEYSKNVKANSYSIDDKTYYVKDINVPFINVDSEYAKNANDEIKKVFDIAIKSFNEGMNDSMTYVDECDYTSKITDSYLSTLLTLGIGATDVVHPKYYVYNVDLKTGKQLSFEDVYKIVGFNSSNIDSKVKTAITSIMKEQLNVFESPDSYPEGTNFATYNNESINNYLESVNDNTIRYFISDNGKLNIIVTLSIPAGSGEFDTIISID